MLAAVMLTAAAITDGDAVRVDIDGSQNRFDIQVAGSAQPGWLPAAADWGQGDPDAYVVPISADGGGYVMAPGGALDVRISPRNASPTLAGDVSMTILDPQPRGDATDPQTGTYLELFDQLVFTVRDGDEVIVDHAHADELATYTWPEPFDAGAYRVLDVTIELPYDVDDRWQQASTDVQFRFEGVSR